MNAVIHSEKTIEQLRTDEAIMHDYKMDVMESLSEKLANILDKLLSFFNGISGLFGGAGAGGLFGDEALIPPGPTPAFETIKTPAYETTVPSYSWLECLEIRNQWKIHGEGVELMPGADISELRAKQCKKQSAHIWFTRSMRNTFQSIMDVSSTALMAACGWIPIAGKICVAISYLFTCIPTLIEMKIGSIVKKHIDDNNRNIEDLKYALLYMISYEFFSERLLNPGSSSKILAGATNCEDFISFFGTVDKINDIQNSYFGKDVLSAPDNNIDGSYNMGNSILGYAYTTNGVDGIDTEKEDISEKELVDAYENYKKSNPDAFNVGLNLNPTSIVTNVYKSCTPEELSLNTPDIEGTSDYITKYVPYLIESITTYITNQIDFSICFLTESVILTIDTWINPHFSPFIFGQSGEIYKKSIV